MWLELKIKEDALPELARSRLIGKREPCTLVSNCILRSPLSLTCRQLRLQLVQFALEVGHLLRKVYAIRFDLVY